MAEVAIQRCAIFTLFAPVSCGFLKCFKTDWKCDVIKTVCPDSDPQLPGRQLPEPANTGGSVEHFGRPGRLHEPRASCLREARSSSANNSQRASCPAAGVPPTPSNWNLVRKVARSSFIVSTCCIFHSFLQRRSTGWRKKIQSSRGWFLPLLHFSKGQLGTWILLKVTILAFTKGSDSREL